MSREEPAMFLLDTDHITILQTQAQPDYGRLEKRMAVLPLEEFFFSVVSFHEQVLGINAYIQRARRPGDFVDGYEMFNQVIDQYTAAQVSRFDAAASAVFEALRAAK